MTMTVEEEERFLADKLSGAKMALAKAKSDAAYYAAQKNAAEKYLEEVQQAAVDYMRGNGLFECASMVLKKSTSIHVADVASVPQEFLRTKTVVEPDKRKIAEFMPQGNWYNVEESYYVTTKSE